MARPIAGINDYPYGVCGYIANGVHFHNMMTATNLRIYKQRSDVMFDLIDPNTMKVTQKLLITGVDIFGNPLDYSLTDEQLINNIPRNTFFVRGYNQSNTIQGFVVRWLLNKKILSNGKVLFDIYQPECGIPPIDISNIVVDPVKEGDISITGHIDVPGGIVNITGMVIEATLPDGSTVTGIVNVDGSFEIDLTNPIHGPGDVVIKITSPNYNDKEITVPILPDGTDSEYVTEIYMASADQTKDGNYYKSVIPENLHRRGKDLVIQLQNSSPSRDIFFADVSVLDGDITIKKDDDAPFFVVIIGKTLLSTPYKQTINWEEIDGKFVSTITQQVHGKHNISYTLYDGTQISSVNVDIESNEDIIIKSDDNFAASIVIAGKS